MRDVKNGKGDELLDKKKEKSTLSLSLLIKVILKNKTNITKLLLIWAYDVQI